MTLFVENTRKVGGVWMGVMKTKHHHRRMSIGCYFPTK